MFTSMNLFRHTAIMINVHKYESLSSLYCHQDQCDNVQVRGFNVLGQWLPQWDGAWQHEQHVPTGHWGWKHPPEGTGPEAFHFRCQLSTFTFNVHKHSTFTFCFHFLLPFLIFTFNFKCFLPFLLLTFTFCFNFHFPCSLFKFQVPCSTFRG